MRRSEVLAAESVSCLNKALCHLKDIWEEIGIPEDQRLQRTNVVKNHIKGLLDMMIKEEESLRNRVMSSIQDSKNKLEKLCLDLQIPIHQDEVGLTMLQQENSLRTQVEGLLTEKTSRMQQLKALREQDQELCDILCSIPFCISPDSVPSKDQLNSFEQHIANQNAEKANRYAEFMGLKKQIILCMNDLDHFPETSFEKDVVCEQEDLFCLSSENITSLKLLLCKLEQDKAENEAACEALREKIQQLWDRLQVPQEEREVFNEHMVMSKKSNLKALQAGIDHLEELKLKNMCHVTDAIRSEIAVFWEKCFFSTEQRQAFSPYFSQDFTEELLSLHDAEIQRLKQHYENHKELFDGVQQWEQNWRLFLELDKKATDPSRFANRGGNLLKEEKQRAELHKNLPKLEKKLKGQIDAWESEQGSEFMVNGQKFLQYVAEQWQAYQSEKDREKLQRHLKKSKQTEEDMLYGTAQTPKRRLLGSNTPNKSKWMNASSSVSMATSNSTIRSAYSGIICRSPVPRSPMRRPPLSAKKGSAQKIGGGKPPHPKVNTCNKENETRLKGTPLSGALLTPASPQCNISLNSVASTYSEFVRDLSMGSKPKIHPHILNSTITKH
ncbi:protein regulator of cytokinesis 1-like isoform X1 [Corythoichthys intestinalis]|uniref:protein regulator of cytokinesis 1-like isoform X1 n=1 Tax=Corythoichthys intestinalis TaxID=161448 RepID=UPI0025A54888|nr:protein regulator of cytokinesis 1-like isoform X1 [Corythoichthys intestinalis]XP_061811228.1 protein regulator of cytokinesis 1-like [Nerophis lumbriciformis]